MSMPYGQSPPAPQPGPAGTPIGSQGLGKILVLVTGGLGLIIYFLSFSDAASGYLRGLLGVLLLGGGLLAAASLLPKAPVMLVPATVLVVTGTLFLLVDVARSPAFLGPASGLGHAPGLVIVALVLAFLQSAVCAVALLVDMGVVKMAPRPSPFPQPTWGPQQPGGYPRPAAPGGYPGRPAGPPSGGYSPQLQQPYPPQTAQYRTPQGLFGGEPGRYGDEPRQPGQYSGDPRQPGQYGDEPRQPGQYGDEPRQPSQHGNEPRQHGDEPRQHRDEPRPGQYGERPGPPSGGFGPPAQG